MSIKKKRGIARFVIMSVLAVLLILGSVLNFSLPNARQYVGFLNALNAPIEYKGGSVLTYRVVNTNTKATDTANGVKAYEYQIKDMLENYSFNVDAKAYYAGDGNYYITINLFDNFDGDTFYKFNDEELDQNNTITSIINQDIEIEFKKEQSLTGEAYLTGKHIKNATALYNSQTRTYGVNLQFTKEGQSAFNTLTSDVSSNGSTSGTIYIYVGGVLFTNINCSEAMDQSSVFISGNMTNLGDTNAYAAKINAARYAFNFVKTNEKIITHQEARVNSLLTIGVYMLVFLALAFVMYGVFKKMGLVSVLTMLLAWLVYIVLLQAIPGIILTQSSVVCLVFPMILGFALSYYMFNNMKKEYALGKKIPASISFGFQKSYAGMIDVCVLGIVPACLLMFLANMSLNSLGYVLALGIFIFGLFSIVVNRWFLNWLLNIDAIHHKKYGFEREAHVNELS